MTEAINKKTIYESIDKKLFANYSCQLNKLNMSYDSAIKIINEKRRKFTDLLRHSMISCPHTNVPAGYVGILKYTMTGVTNNRLLANKLND